MWIAKPVEALSPSEREKWLSTQRRMRAGGEDFPLSQTLSWAGAIAGAGGQADLVMSLEEGVGGIVHRVSSSGAFECVNGPILDWEDPGRIARQLSTFVMAVTKLSREFSSVALAPRWSPARLEPRLSLLPIEPQGLSRASTLQLTVLPTEEERMASLSCRLRRSIRLSKQQGVRTAWLDPDSARLRSFAQGMRDFGASRGFFVPDEKWFESLVFGRAPGGEARFHLVESLYGQPGSRDAGASRLLVCVSGESAHYLFGYDERGPGLRAAISTAAAAHFRVLEECSAAGVRTYDLNGFTDPGIADHPYAGVSRFKAQFGGRIVDYISPAFRIEAG